MKAYFSKIFTLLFEDKKKIPILAILFLATSFLDAFSIALLLPFMQILTNFDSFYESYQSLLSYFQLSKKDQIIQFLGIMLILIFAIKALSSILVNWAILKISFERQAKIKKQLINKYLNMQYQNYIEQNSARYIQVIQSLSIQFIKVLQGFLRLISDGLIFISILFVLAFVEGPLLLYLGIIMLMLIFIYDRFFRTRLEEQSKNITDSSVEVTKIVTESINGLKEIKILGKQQFFEEILKINADIYAKNNIYADLIRTQPKHIVELVFVLIFTLSILFYPPLQDNFQNAIPTLGVFLFAAIRLIPILNQMLSSVNTLRVGQYPTSLLYEDMTTEQELEQNSIQNSIAESFEELTLENLSFSYKNNDKYQLLDINFNIKKNMSIGLYGQSGSGKTTLVDVMLGLLRVKKGKIILNGEELNDQHRFRKMVAYIPQDIFIINDSVKKNITLTDNDTNIDQDLLLESINKSKLTEVIEDLESGIETNIGERGIKLSGGQKQRIAIARALYHKREFLVMDEATSALDNETEKEIIEEIKKLKGKITMVVIAHRLSTLKYCDEVYEVSNGRMVKRSINDIL